jgi:hypothetical protein
MKVPGWHLTAFGRTFMDTAHACTLRLAIARLTLANWKEIRGWYLLLVREQALSEVACSSTP